jgi:predicted TIM-barrel fold metal-dependent hydrolase
MKDGHQVIDSDGHVIEPADLWDRYIDSQFYGVRPICDPANTEVRTMGHTMSRSHVRTPGSDYDVDDYRKRIVEGWFAKYQAQKEKGFSAESYVEMMDAEGIDQMVLFPSRGLYAASVGDLDGRLSSAICRAYNRWLHDFCSLDPQRLIGAGLVALHDPTLAADEATYAVRELGMRSIMIRPNPYAGRNLEDRAYDEFYATVADLDVALATHEGVGVWMPEYGQDRYE